MNSNGAEVGVDLDGYGPGTSAGALLREARLAAGVHIESIAFSLKVPVSKIEALENDDLAALPDAVFARALTSSVCRTLKIDPAPVLALLPQTKVQALPSNSTGVNATFRDGSERSSSNGVLARLSRPLGLAVVVLVLGAGVLAWMPTEWLQVDVASLPNPGSVVSKSAPEAPPQAENSAPILGSPEVADRSEQVPVAATPASQPASDALSLSTPAAVPPRVLLEARGETWVQVKDAQGSVVLERILRAGEAAAVSQPGRLSVVVGRADVTDVRVSGQKLDIASSARENVARFEVKP